MRRSSVLFCAISGFSLLGYGTARAAYFASSVVAYTPGTISSFDQGYEDPNSAVGSPAGLTGVGTPYQGTLSPFNPAYDTDQLVIVGEGGSLTLKLAVPVKTAGGPSLGVISNVGLDDANYPSGVNSNPAGTFGGGAGEVDVSQNGLTWTIVGNDIAFNLPANYYTDTGPYSSTAGSATSDFGKLFTGSVSEFDGKDYAGTLSELDGSGGGTWLDLSGTGLSEVDFIRFSVPAYTGLAANDPFNRIPIDAIAENTSLVDLSSVPEPTGSAAVGIGLIMLGWRRHVGVR